ncbi:hypothetical protein P9112_000063 [Eukaryota sp. TZLM1-RC]
MNVSGDVVVGGNVYVQGENVKVTTTDLKVENENIYLRKGAEHSLLDGVFTGLIATKYDGENDGRLGFDKNGIAYVGDIGDEQPLATRELEPVDGTIQIWNGGEQRLTSGVLASDLARINEANSFTEPQTFDNIYLNSIEFEYGGKQLPAIFSSAPQTIDLRTIHDRFSEGTIVLGRNDTDARSHSIAYKCNSGFDTSYIKFNIHNPGEGDDVKKKCNDFAIK